MKRRAGAAVAALGLLFAAACSLGGDRYDVKLLPGETIARVTGVTAMAIGPNGAVYYALAAGDVYSLQERPARLVAQFPTTRLDSIAFSADGVLYGAYLEGRGVTVAAWRDGALRQAVRLGSTAHAQIAFGDKGLLIATANRIVDGHGGVVSQDWHAPVMVPGRGSRIWVADDAPGTQKELVARGREKDGPKRRRFASALPERTDPSSIAIRNDELLVCSRRHGTVYRLHVGLDDVARRRGVVKGLRCRSAIVVSPENAVITATGTAILRYGAR